MDANYSQQLIGIINKLNITLENINHNILAISNDLRAINKTLNNKNN